MESLPSGILQSDGETLAQAACRALRTDILSGTRRPGERLRVEKIRSIYGVGPTPLREALQMLAADGLVLAEGNRGFTVAPLEYAEFEDLNIARTAIETAALRLSITKGDSAWEAGVVAAIYLLEKQDAALRASADGVPDAWEQANAAFHLALVAACGSRWLLRARAGMQDQCARYRRASVYQRQGQRDLGGEHRAIADAVLARDTVLACNLVERHFALTAASLPDAPGSQAALR
jgi:DNA-binding GntR family transcriptional regulator